MNTLSNREIVNRVDAFNTASPAAGADILSSGITPSGGAHRYFRVYACFKLAGKLGVKVTVGATTVVEMLNGDTDLIAGAAYLFDIPVSSTQTINFQHSGGVDAVGIKRFIVDEYSG